MGSAKGFEFVTRCHREDTKIANQIVFQMAEKAGFGDGTVSNGKDNIKDGDSDDKVCCLCDNSSVPDMYGGSKPWGHVGKDTQSGKSDVHTYCLNRAYNYKRKVLSHEYKLCIEFKRLWKARNAN